MPSIYVAKPSHCDRCDRDFESKRQMALHKAKDLCRPRRKSSNTYAYALSETRRHSYNSNQDAGNKPSTTLTSRHSSINQNAPDTPSATTSSLRFPANDLAQSPHSYHPPQTSFYHSESYKPPSDITISNPPPKPTYNPKTLPPDVAAARINRINRDLISACRIKRSLRHDQPVSLRGNGTYTHIASQNLQHYNEPVLLPLGGPNRYQLERRVEPELPDEINRAYDILQRALMEEEKLQTMGDTTDPRVRYGALPKPPTMIPPPPPSMDEESSAAAVGDGYSGGPRSAMATTVDVSRDLRLHRNDVHSVYGRR